MLGKPDVGLLLSGHVSGPAGQKDSEKGAPRAPPLTVMGWNLLPMHHTQQSNWAHICVRVETRAPLTLGTPFGRSLGCSNPLKSPGCPQLPSALSSKVTKMNPVMAAWPSGWLCCKSLLPAPQAWLHRWSSRYGTGQPPQEESGKKRA